MPLALLKLIDLGFQVTFSEPQLGHYRLDVADWRGNPLQSFAGQDTLGLLAHAFGWAVRQAEAGAFAWIPSTYTIA